MPHVHAVCIYSKFRRLNGRYIRTEEHSSTDRKNSLDVIQEDNNSHLDTSSTETTETTSRLACFKRISDKERLYFYFSEVNGCWNIGPRVDHAHVFASSPRVPRGSLSEVLTPNGLMWIVATVDGKAFEDAGHVVVTGMKM